MESLRKTWKRMWLSLMFIQRQISISHVNLNEIEHGKQAPVELTCQRLEMLMGRRINWMEEIIKEPSSPPATWFEREKKFRKL